MLVPAPVQPPYRIVAFTTSVFGQKDSTFAIYTGGADRWGGINEFGTIYRPAALTVGFGHDRGHRAGRRRPVGNRGGVS